MTIIINVIDQQIAVRGHKVPLAPHSENFIKLTFSLSSEWKNFKTFAQFRQSNNPPVNVYLDESNSVYVPREIKAGNFTVMLYGAGESIIGTTNCLIFDMVDNCFSANAIETDLTPTLYQQLLNEFKSYLASTKVNSESATASENAAKSYATAADASAKSATTSANNAIAAEKSAKDSATKANASQTAAEESENNAKASANDAKSAKSAAFQAYSDAVTAKEGADTAAETASGYADSAKASALECSNTLESVTAERKSAETNAASAEDARKSASISAAEAKKSENQVKNAITEANYQLLYLENGRLMLYKSDATSNDLDFHIKDHKNLEVTFS